MKSLYYIFILTSLVLGCSEEKNNPNRRILNNIKWTRQYLSTSNKNEFIIWMENNNYNNDSTFRNILNEINKIRKINRKYSKFLEGLAVKSDSFELQLSSIQNKYKEEILQNLNKRTRTYLSEIPYDNIFTGEKITIQSAEESELAKEAILNEIEMNNFVIPNLILRQWGQILPHCECCNNK